MHGLHLSDNLSFKQICDKKAIVIDYLDKRYSDVEVSNNKLVKRSDDDPLYYSSTNTVGDTELISTFLERSKLTDLRWIARTDNSYQIQDVSVGPFPCDVEAVISRSYHCIPPHHYGPRYIWTAPQQQGLAM